MAKKTKANPQPRKPDAFERMVTESVKNAKERQRSPQKRAEANEAWRRDHADRLRSRPTINT